MSNIANLGKAFNKAQKLARQELNTRPQFGNMIGSTSVNVGGKTITATALNNNLFPNQQNVVVLLDQTGTRGFVL